MATRKSKSRPVLVTTAHRGVFVGHTSDAGDAETIELTQARMIVRWTGTKGVLGIASGGVNRNCRVTDPVDRIVLRSVTAVIDATVDAAKSWETAPWG